MGHRDIIQRLTGDTLAASEQGAEDAHQYAIAIGASIPAYDDLPAEIQELVQTAVSRCVACYDGLNLRDNPDATPGIEIINRFRYIVADLADLVLRRGNQGVMAVEAD
jgi:hypothetical protein